MNVCVQPAFIRERFQGNDSVTDQMAFSVSQRLTIKRITLGRWSRKEKHKAPKTGTIRRQENVRPVHLAGPVWRLA